MKLFENSSFNSTVPLTETTLKLKAIHQVDRKYFIMT